MNLQVKFRKVVNSGMILFFLASTPNVFAQGSPFSNRSQPQPATFQVYGAIGDKWRQLGAESGPLGEPRSNELDAARGGRYNAFANGFIYWHPNLGAYAVYGLIGEKWNILGRESGFGYPLTDEKSATGSGRYNDFEDGKSIYWSPRTGAHAIYGAIRDKWISTGREHGKHGYPKTDEYAEAGGRFRRVDFECGYIRWSERAGATSEACIRMAEPQLNPVQ